MTKAKLAGPIIGAAGVIVAAVIAVMGSSGGDPKPTTVVYVPAQPPVAGQPAAAPTTQPSAAPKPVAAAESVIFSVYDDLDESQLGVRVDVYIDSELKGSLRIDASQGESQATLKIRVPRAGTYPYRIDVAAAFLNEMGEAFTVSHDGRGRIDVAGGDVFYVAFENGVLSLKKR